MTGLHTQQLHRCSIMANAAGGHVTGPRACARSAARRPGPRAAPTSRRPAATAAPAMRRAMRAASSGERPSASWAASTDACVQPEPCAAPSGWRSPSISTAGPSPARVHEQVDRARAMPAGEHDVPRPERQQRPSERLDLGVLVGAGRTRSRAGERARLWQVRREHARARQDLPHQRAPGRRARAGARPTRRPSPGRPPRACPRAARRAPPRPRAIISAVPSMPTLTASTPMSAEHSAHLREHDLRRHVWTALTPTVFWAVIAVIALVPCTPQRANAFRSAWMPAPPPESEPAIVSATGVRGGEAPEPALLTGRRWRPPARRGRAARAGCGSSRCRPRSPAGARLVANLRFHDPHGPVAPVEHRPADDLAFGRRLDVVDRDADRRDALVAQWSAPTASSPCSSRPSRTWPRPRAARRG